MLNEIYSECETKMQGSIEHMQRDFKTLRTGKITTSVLDNIKSIIMEHLLHLIKLVLL